MKCFLNSQLAESYILAGCIVPSMQLLGDWTLSEKWARRLLYEYSRSLSPCVLTVIIDRLLGVENRICSH